MNRKILFLVGPTGSAKTELSLLLARRLGCEIVSADSMQVYRGMDIGTAKSSLSDRRKIRHHLIDLVSPRSNFSVYEYRKRALAAIEAILRLKKNPLVVGGSGLYLGALWKGLSMQPAGDPGLRQQLEKEAGQKGLRSLYVKLQRLDPKRARQIHPHDRRRIIRAVEIAALSGKTPSEWYRDKESLADLGYRVRIFGIQRDRADLYGRINQRVEEMFDKGFVREVKRLKRSGLSRTARQALGYREILEYLKKCGGGHKEATLPLIQDIQKRTRQFAKRQLTWFRREKEICWIPWRQGESANRVCDKIVAEING